MKLNKFIQSLSDKQGRQIVRLLETDAKDKLLELRLNGDELREIVFVNYVRNKLNLGK